MTALAAKGVDLYKIADRSLSGWMLPQPQDEHKFPSSSSICIYARCHNT